MTRHTILATFLFISFAANSQNATKYSNEFLQIGIGARYLGMGGASVASANDVFAGYWNPAGLMGIEDNAQVSLMYASYFAGIANYTYGAWAGKAGDKGVLGISFIRFGIDGIPNTFDLIRNGEIDYSRVTSFNATDFAMMISYAQKEKFRKSKHISFSWGGSVKIIRRKVGSFAKANGFGFDAGAKFNNTRSEWSAGVVVRDATSTFNSWRYSFTDAQKDVLAATNNSIPVNSLEITLPRIMGGFAKYKDFNQWRILGELDAEITLDGKRNTLIRTNLLSIAPVLGAEVSYNINDKNFVYFRTGLNNFQQYTNENGKKTSSVMPNAGVGFTFDRFSLDYTLANLSSIGASGSGLYSNIISLKLAMNKEKN